jgi:hypothetical protein
MGGSSGSSGGGSSSGAVSHSAYLEAIHGNWLNHTATDTIGKSITEVMDSALGNSPWTGALAYDPDADIAAYEAVLAAFSLVLSGLSDTVDWATMYAQADLTLAGVAEAAIIADAAAFGAILDSDLNTKILPRFRRGMQDINAVVSSAYVLGLSVIEGFRDREIAKHTSVLRLDVNARKISATDQMVQMMGRRITWNEDYVKTFIEATRIKIVAKKEETDRNAIIEDADAKWDLGVFQHGANLLAAIGGGTAVPYLPGTNSTATAIGGTLAVIGAAAQVYSAVNK